MTIGELARSVGVGVETIRFYERKGMIEEPPRRPSGYRQYDPEVIRRLRFIRRTKELGFSLAEIRELLELRAGSHTACEDIRDQLEEKIVDVQSKIADLQHMRRALKEFSQTCEAQDPHGECPILAALEHTAEGSA
jgi:Hg(II)-responsive transcriptional regulator